MDESTDTKMTFEEKIPLSASGGSTSSSLSSISNPVYTIFLAHISSIASFCEAHEILALARCRFEMRYCLLDSSSGMSRLKQAWKHTTLILTLYSNGQYVTGLYTLQFKSTSSSSPPKLYFSTLSSIHQDTNQSIFIHQELEYLHAVGQIHVQAYYNDKLHSLNRNIPTGLDEYPYILNYNFPFIQSIPRVISDSGVGRVDVAYGSSHFYKSRLWGNTSPSYGSNGVSLLSAFANIQSLTLHFHEYNHLGGNLKPILQSSTLKELIVYHSYEDTLQNKLVFFFDRLGQDPQLGAQFEVLKFHEQLANKSISSLVATTPPQQTLFFSVPSLLHFTKLRVLHLSSIATLCEMNLHYLHLMTQKEKPDTHNMNDEEEEDEQKDTHIPEVKYPLHIQTYLRYHQTNPSMNHTSQYLMKCLHQLPCLEEVDIQDSSIEVSVMSDWTSFLIWTPTQTPVTHLELSPITTHARPPPHPSSTFMQTHMTKHPSGRLSHMKSEYYIRSITKFKWILKLPTPTVTMTMVTDDYSLSRHTFREMGYFSNTLMDTYWSFVTHLSIHQDDHLFVKTNPESKQVIQWLQSMRSIRSLSLYTHILRFQTFFSWVHESDFASRLQHFQMHIYIPEFHNDDDLNTSIRFIQQSIQTPIPFIHLHTFQVRYYGLRGMMNPSTHTYKPNSHGESCIRHLEHCILFHVAWYTWCVTFSSLVRMSQLKSFELIGDSCAEILQFHHIYNNVKKLNEILLLHLHATPQAWMYHLSESLQSLTIYDPSNCFLPFDPSKENGFVQPGIPLRPSETISSTMFQSSFHIPDVMKQDQTCFFNLFKSHTFAPDSKGEYTIDVDITRAHSLFSLAVRCQHIQVDAREVTGQPIVDAILRLPSLCHLVFFSSGCFNGHEIPNRKKRFDHKKLELLKWYLFASKKLSWLSPRQQELLSNHCVKNSMQLYGYVNCESIF